MTLHANAFPQSFALSGKGLVGLQIGDTLKSGISGLLPAKKYPNPQKFSLWDEDRFDYYFVNTPIDMLVSVDSITVEDIFIGTTKQQVIAGVIFHVKKSNWKELSAVIDRVFGLAKLASTSGQEGVTSRWKKYWHRDGISLLASTFVEAEKIQITIAPPSEGHKPGMRLR